MVCRTVCQSHNAKGRCKWFCRPVCQSHNDKGRCKSFCRPVCRSHNDKGMCNGPVGLCVSHTVIRVCAMALWACVSATQ